MQLTVRAALLATVALIAVLVPGVSTADVRPPVDIGIHPADPVEWSHLVGNSVKGVGLVIALDDQPPNSAQVLITLQLPRGWAASCHAIIGSEILRRCSAGRKVVALARPPRPGSNNTFTLIVYPASDIPDDAVTVLHLHAEPVGATDSDPSDNDLAASVRMHGVADLSATLTQTATTAMVGDTVGFTLTITNAGPDRAQEPGVEFDGHGMISGRLSVDTPDSGCSTLVSGSGPDRIPAVLCQFLPYIAPRRTLTVRVLWTVGAGDTRGVLRARFGEFATDPDVPAENTAGLGLPLGALQPELSSLPVTVGGKVPVPPLANTGVAAVTSQLLAGLAAILLGAGLVLAGSRRSCSYARGRATIRRWRASESPGSRR